MHNLLTDILACPRCGADTALGLNATAAECNNCQTRYFDLDGLPCWFPLGLKHKHYWKHLLAEFEEERAQLKTIFDYENQQPNLLHTTKQRLEMQFKQRYGTYSRILDLLKKSGLSAKKSDQYKDFSTDMLTQYFGVTLRDWAWHPLEDQTNNYRRYIDENAGVLSNILSTLADVNEFSQKKLLVIGSGAGRLSWDLHCEFNSNLTVALDFNPLLGLIAKQLIHDKKTLHFEESRTFPRKGLPENHEWQLKCESDSDERRGTWQPICADAWALPFARGSFDIIVTPWFMDINGQDAKALIAQVEQTLKPGGYWINYGPFLYVDSLRESQRYTSDELRELLSLAKFDLLNEDFFSEPYTHSPLSEKGRIDESWCFVARSAEDQTHLLQNNNDVKQVNSNNPPAWLVLPHLPIPALATQDNIPKEMANVARLIDGKRSLNEITAILQNALPETIDPYDFMYQFLQEYVLR